MCCERYSHNGANKATAQKSHSYKESKFTAQTRNKDAMSVSSDRSVRSGGTIDSTSTRKKRTIVVIRRRQSGRDDEPNRNNGGSGASASPGRKKKTIMVSRRPRPSEGKLFDDVCPGGQQGGSGALDGTTGDSSPREKLRWSTDGRVHERSILGTADAFEEVFLLHKNIQRM